MASVLFYIAGLGMLAGQSHGYVFFGPGGVTAGDTSSAAYMGAGGEGVFGPGIGVGAEVGYATPWKSFRSGIGIGSVNGSFHFKRSGRIVPFLTGGYSIFFRSGHENGINVGGGVNWWFSDRLGLKAEFRDHISTTFVDVDNDVHLWVLRAGLTFR
jgi:hypothetical protein